jgi:hypothetical protein
MFGTQVPTFFFDRVPQPSACDRLQRLAFAQIWADRRPDSLVPPRLAITLSQRSISEAVSSLFRRVRPSGQESATTVPQLGTFESAGLEIGFRRTLNDLKVKTPQYVRAWRNGGLRWSSLMKAARLARGRVEIKEIMIDPRC